MNYRGYYINLDRSPQRRTQIEGELQRHNITHLYERFRAADGNILNLSSAGQLPGAIGCWISYALLLKKNIGTDRHLHIVEDDAVFTDCTAQVIRWVIDDGHLDNCDIILTDVSVALRNDIYKFYKSLYDDSVEHDKDGKILRVKFQIIDLAKITWAATTSFLVNKNSVRKVHDVLEQEMRRGVAAPIDLFLRQKNFEGVLKIGCVFPFITSLRLQDALLSNIDPNLDRRPEVAAALGRYAFFIGCDRTLCRSYLEQYVLPAIPEDWLTSHLQQLLGYSITDQYRFF